MERFIQRKEDLIKAYNKLEEALTEECTEIVIDGILHRFEFTFELAWKTIKDYLDYMGISEKTGSPREVIQQGFKQGIIDDGEKWIDMMLSRNQLSHLYNQDISRQIYNNIKNEYIKLLRALIKKLENM